MLPRALLSLFLIVVFLAPVQPAHALPAVESPLSPQVISAGGAFTSLYLDGQDHAHISFVKMAGDVLHLFYATNKSGAWVVQDTGMPASLTHTSIVVDSLGTAYIGYLYALEESATYSLNIVYKPESASGWTLAQKSCTSNKYEAVYGPSLAVDNLDIVHAGFIVYSGVSSYTHSFLYMIGPTTGGFTCFELLPLMSGSDNPNAVQAPSIDVDESRHVTFSFATFSTGYTMTQEEGFIVKSYTTLTRPVLKSNRYMHMDEGKMVHPGIYSFAGQIQFYSSLAGPDANGRYAVSYLDGTGCLSLNGFTLECGADLVGEYNSAAFDSQGRVHIVYYDRAIDSLKYLTTELLPKQVFMPTVRRQ